MEQCEPRKPQSEVAAVDGGEPASLGLSMGGDDEIRDEMLSRPSSVPIPLESGARKMRCRRGNSVIHDAKTTEQPHELRLVSR